MALPRTVPVLVDDETARRIDRRLAAGGYADAGDVVARGIEALEDEEQVLETWLREVVGPSVDAYRADPANTVPVEDIMDRLRARRSRA
jgi:Arc/MetJ-type ribon-helix-helix transcriptional regulator